MALSAMIDNCSVMGKPYQPTASVCVRLASVLSRKGLCFILEVMSLLLCYFYNVWSVQMAFVCLVFFLTSYLAKEWLGDPMFFLILMGEIY